MRENKVIESQTAQRTAALDRRGRSEVRIVFQILDLGPIIGIPGSTLRHNITDGAPSRGSEIGEPFACKYAPGGSLYTLSALAL